MHGNFRVVFSQEVVSGYQNILACSENTLKAYKRIKRIRQECFTVYGEYADRYKTEPIWVNFRPQPNF